MSKDEVGNKTFKKKERLEQEKGDSKGQEGR